MPSRRQRYFPLNKNFTRPNSNFLRKQNKRFERQIQLIALLFFIGCFTLYYYGGQTMWTWINLSRIYVGFAVAFSFLPTKVFPKIYQYHKELKVLMAICALAPLFTGITLALNFHVTDASYTETYKVEKTLVYFDQKQVEVHLEGKKLNDHHGLRRFNYRLNPPIADSVKLTVAKGLFKIKVVKDRELILR